MYSQIYSGAPHINWIINFSSSISISLLEINSLLSKVKRVIRLTRQLFLYFFPGFINKTISRDKPVWRNWAEKGCNQYSTPTRPRPQTLDPCPYICAPLLSLPGPPIALTLSRSQKSCWSIRSHTLYKEGWPQYFQLFPHNGSQLSTHSGTQLSTLTPLSSNHDTASDRNGKTLFSIYLNNHDGPHIGNTDKRN